MPAWMLCLAWSAMTAAPSAEDRLEQLLSFWAAERDRIETLVVDYLIHIGHSDKSFEATLKLLRAQDGTLRGRLQIRPKSERGKAEDYWLIDRTIYRADTEAKTLTRLDLKRPPEIEFFARTLHPAILVLDPRQAQAAFQFNVTKQNEHYTYIDVLPGDDWSREFAYVRLVIANRHTAGVPRDMPAQFYRVDPNRSEQRMDIVKWRRNDPRSVRPEEFDLPDPKEWKTDAVSPEARRLIFGKW